MIVVDLHKSANIHMACNYNQRGDMGNNYVLDFKVKSAYFVMPERGRELYNLLASATEGRCFFLNGFFQF